MQQSHQGKQEVQRPRRAKKKQGLALTSLKNIYNIWYELETQQNTQKGDKK